MITRLLKPAPSFLFCLSLIAAIACQKTAAKLSTSTGTGTDTTGRTAATVYVLVHGNDSAFYWKNGVLTILPDTASPMWKLTA